MLRLVGLLLFVALAMADKPGYSRTMCMPNLIGGSPELNSQLCNYTAGDFTVTSLGNFFSDGGYVGGRLYVGGNMITKGRFTAGNQLIYRKGHGEKGELDIVEEMDYNKNWASSPAVYQKMPYTVAVGGETLCWHKGSVLPKYAGIFSAVQQRARPKCLSQKIQSEITANCPLHLDQCLESSTEEIRKYYHDQINWVATKTPNALVIEDDEDPHHLTFSGVEEGTPYRLIFHVDADVFSRATKIDVQRIQTTQELLIYIRTTKHSWYDPIRFQSTFPHHPAKTAFFIDGPGKEIIVTSSFNGSLIAPDRDLMQIQGSFNGFVVVNNVLKFTGANFVSCNVEDECPEQTTMCNGMCCPAGTRCWDGSCCPIQRTCLSLDSSHYDMKYEQKPYYADHGRKGGFNPYGYEMRPGIGMPEPTEPGLPICCGALPFAGPIDDQNMGHHAQVHGGHYIKPNWFHGAPVGCVPRVNVNDSVTTTFTPQNPNQMGELAEEGESAEGEEGQEIPVQNPFDFVCCPYPAKAFCEGRCCNSCENGMCHPAIWYVNCEGAPAKYLFSNVAQAVADYRVVDGDTILVCPGHYPEAVHINKSLTIRGHAETEENFDFIEEIETRYGAMAEKLGGEEGEEGEEGTKDSEEGEEGEEGQFGEGGYRSYPDKFGYQRGEYGYGYPADDDQKKNNYDYHVATDRSLRLEENKEYRIERKKQPKRGPGWVGEFPFPFIDLTGKTNWKVSAADVTIEHLYFRMQQPCVDVVQNQDNEAASIVIMQNSTLSNNLTNIIIRNNHFCGLNSVFIDTDYNTTRDHGESCECSKKEELLARLEYLNTVDGADYKKKQVKEEDDFAQSGSCTDRQEPFGVSEGITISNNIFKAYICPTRFSTLDSLSESMSLVDIKGFFGVARVENNYFFGGDVAISASDITSLLFNNNDIVLTRTWSRFYDLGELYSCFNLLSTSTNQFHTLSVHNVDKAIVTHNKISGPIHSQDETIEFHCIDAGEFSHNEVENGEIEVQYSNFEIVNNDFYASYVLMEYVPTATARHNQFTFGLDLAFGAAYVQDGVFIDDNYFECFARYTIGVIYAEKATVCSNTIKHGGMPIYVEEVGFSNVFNNVIDYFGSFGIFMSTPARIFNNQISKGLGPAIDYRSYGDDVNEDYRHATYQVSDNKIYSAGYILSREVDTCDTDCVGCLCGINEIKQAKYANNKIDSCFGVGMAIKKYTADLDVIENTVNKSIGYGIVLCTQSTDDTADIKLIDNTAEYVMNLEEPNAQIRIGGPNAILEESGNTPTPVYKESCPICFAFGKQQQHFGKQEHHFAFGKHHFAFRKQPQ